MPPRAGRRALRSAGESWGGRRGSWLRRRVIGGSSEGPRASCPGSFVLSGLARPCLTRSPASSPSLSSFRYFPRARFRLGYDVVAGPSSTTHYSRARGCPPLVNWRPLETARSVVGYAEDAEQASGLSPFASSARSRVARGPDRSWNGEGGRACGERVSPPARLDSRADDSPA